MYEIDYEIDYNLNAKLKQYGDSIKNGNMTSASPPSEYYAVLNELVSTYPCIQHYVFDNNLIYPLGKNYYEVLYYLVTDVIPRQLAIQKQLQLEKDKDKIVTTQSSEDLGFDLFN